MAFLKFSAGLLLLSSGATAVAPYLGPDLGLDGDMLQHYTDLTAGRESNILDAPNPADLYPTYNLSVPIDHFHNDSMYEPHSNGSFNLRYWFDDRFYKEGGPVIVLAAGETGGEGRLTFLQKGIVAILAEATDGMGVILEHRYYGESYVTPDLSTESLRFLTTDQALADTAYFAKNIVFPGYKGVDLTSPGTPWVAYGGSYAGAFVAFLRKLYPEVFWGSISSSGVTAAIVDYWENYEAARLYSPEGCALATQKVINVADNILLGGNEDDIAMLKKAFGLSGVTDNTDFASAIQSGISGLQSVNWDPALSSTSFAKYCSDVTATEVIYPPSAELNATVANILTAGGYGDEIDTLNVTMLNYIGRVASFRVAQCQEEDKNACFGARADSPPDLSQSWRLWTYQVCTQWGYFQTGSGGPKTQLPLISRLIDLNYSSSTCRDSFEIYDMPDVDAINKHGGLNFSYPRVAIIDGEADPWRAATPHKIGLDWPPSTDSEPRMLIGGGAVHHWDENGVFENETTPDLPPQPVREAQSFIVEFVQKWLEEWGKEKGSGSVSSRGEGGLRVQ